MKKLLIGFMIMTLLATCLASEKSEYVRRQKMKMRANYAASQKEKQEAVTAKQEKENQAKAELEQKDTDKQLNEKYEKVKKDFAEKLEKNKSLSREQKKEILKTYTDVSGKPQEDYKPENDQKFLDELAKDTALTPEKKISKLKEHYQDQAQPEVKAKKSTTPPPVKIIRVGKTNG
jgi:hypothetical protein